MSIFKKVPEPTTHDGKEPAPREITITLSTAIFLLVWSTLFILPWYFVYFTWVMSFAR